jgi:hypothetical protein
LPPTWTFTLDGRKVVITGDALPLVHLRLDSRPSEDLIRKVQGKEVELEAGTAAGGGLRKFKVRVDALARIRARDNWERLAALVLPPEYTAGAPVLATPAENFSEGVWLPGGTLTPGPSNPNEELAKERIREAAKRIEGMTRETGQMLRNSVLNQGPPAAAPAPPRMIVFDEPPTSVSFFDRYLDMLLEGTPSWKEAPAATCERAISGGTPLAFAGQTACVSGCFPSERGGLEEAARLLMLDDQVPLVPQAGSPTTIVLRVPPETRPGPHVITWKAGESATGRLQFGVLQLEGTIDQNELWKGQATTMRLRIIGSDQPLPLNIINRTPATIEIDGGERQVVSTSGGPDNAVTRQVRGIMKGDFTIDYRLDQPPCGAGR